MNLLAFKVNQLGDNLVFVAVLQQIRRLWPEGNLTVFTTPGVRPLYGGRFAPSRVVAIERSTFNRGWRRPTLVLQWLKAARATRAEASLVSFDQGSVAHALARLAGGRVRVGSAELEIRLPAGLTHRVSFAPAASIAEWNWAMGRTLAAALGRGNDWPASLVPPDLSHLIPPAPALSPKTQPCVAIHAGASLPYRRWPLERFAQLAGRLARDANVVWIDTPETQEAHLVSGVRRVTCPDLACLATELATVDCFVGNNSGPMHLAAAFGRRGVVISGPSHPQWDPAWQPERWTILRAASLPCLPCEGLRSAPGDCLNKTAPLVCLQSWSVDAVEARVRAALEECPSS